MKSFNEVQTHAQLLVLEQQQLKHLLAAPHLLARLTLDAVYEAERDLLRVAAEVRALVWVLGQNSL